MVSAGFYFNADLILKQEISSFCPSYLFVFIELRTVLGWFQDFYLKEVPHYTFGYSVVIDQWQTCHKSTFNDMK